MISSPDFIVEFAAARGIVYYTPQSHAAYDWCNGTGETPSTSTANMKGVPMHGRSFMFRDDNPRANKLRGYLKGVKNEDVQSGFNVVTIGLPPTGGAQKKGR